MAKWSSSIFTDIRNKLANNVVFSMWKGRPYFRKYVKPANPKTNAQYAYRYKIKEIVKSWQDKDASISSFKSLWNKIGLEKLISGYNAYVSEAQKGKISCPETGTAGTPFTVTYTLSFPAKHASLYAHNVSEDTWHEKVSKGGLTSGSDQTVQITIESAGQYEIWICDERALDPTLSNPDKTAAMAVIHWDVDTENGEVKEATITLST